MLTLESKGSKAVQRIDNETFIDFNLLKSFNFKSWLENIDKEVLYNMYIVNNMSEYLIAKTLKRDRRYIKNQLKEYNLSKSAQQPKNG